MSAPIASTQPRPWYREPWPWLLMLPPAASIAGGVALIYLATATPNTLVVDDYARIEELTDERFARDARAVELGLEAELAFESAPPRVEVSLHGAEGDLPSSMLLLQLRHATDPEADRSLELSSAGNRYVATVELTPGRYGIELMPEDRAWRLAGAITRTAGRIRLTPQGGGPLGEPSGPGD